MKTPPPLREQLAAAAGAAAAADGWSSWSSVSDLSPVISHVIGHWSETTINYTEMRLMSTRGP